MSSFRLIFVFISLCSSAIATAQNNQVKPATSSATVSPNPAVAPNVPTPNKISLEDAYQKEYAFLAAQKRELSERIGTLKSRYDADFARLQNDLSGKENRLLQSKSQAEFIASELTKAEMQNESGNENTAILGATLEQALASLDARGKKLAQEPQYLAANDAMKLAQIFTDAQSELTKSGAIIKSNGSFYLQSGGEVQGQIIRIGEIAALGVSEQGAGVLAPAGGGKFKIWNTESADAARAFAENKSPSSLPLFVYESLAVAVDHPEIKTFWGEMKKGGAIGYVIMVLGAIAMLLAALRVFFLRGAGASVQKIYAEVRPAMERNKLDEAISAAKQFKGSAARVVTAALRNIERDREHLEDIISESILHESGHLNRFGTFITLTAAVAPLLGLLGTVTGMIQTFDVITEFGNSDPKMLSGGIATALVTTEQGLLVAIPCLLIGSLLNGWAENIKDDMEQAALKVVNLFHLGKTATKAI